MVVVAFAVSRRPSWTEAPVVTGVASGMALPGVPVQLLLIVLLAAVLTLASIVITWRRRGGAD